MDSSAMSWLSEMELDDAIFMDQCDFLDSFDEDVVAIIRQDLEQCLSTQNQNSSNFINIDHNPCSNSVESGPESPELGPEPPAKLQKPNDFSVFSKNNPGPSNDNNNNKKNRSSSTPIILNFANSPENIPQVNSGAVLSPEEEAVVGEEQSKPKKKTGRARPPSQTYDHIVAERKRRELLSQRFVALSTIVPGLKKMDKTSVLGDTVKYLKHLQEKVKTLEEQQTKQTMESVVFVRKSKIVAEDEGSSDDERSGSSDELPLPEIEARFCNNRVLLRVQCEKQKGLLGNLLSKIEKLNLVVVNTNVTTFGRFVLDISIIAEMEKEFKLTAKEVVKRLRAALHSFNKSS